MKIIVSIICLVLFLYTPVFAQTHTSVSLESQVYYILEQAEVRGLCEPVSGIKPYTQSIVIAYVSTILNSPGASKLRAAEREILEQYLETYSKPKQGMDWHRGLYHDAISVVDIPVSLNIGGNLMMEGSAGWYDSLREGYWGADVWVRFYLSGDVGRYVSWEFAGEGGLMKAPRKQLGEGNTYYAGFKDDPDGEFVNNVLPVYSEPLTHFPYSYKKRWDGSVFYLNNLSGFESWPESVSGGYNLQSEITASFLENKLIMRLGRISREWGSVPLGSSLALNQMARPFLGMEAGFAPFSWFGITTMTGILEYSNIAGIKDSAMNFQNAYSVTMLQFKYKSFASVDLGEAVIWPKRFELGYPSPITNSIFYQNNIGDFDNMAMFLNIKAQFPGYGTMWASLFWDEAYWQRDWDVLDRSMLAGQLGVNVPLPFLAFSSVKLSYTRVNPYCYTHNRNFNPWYGDLPMETSYTNNGACLGYYLPPNSDELLLRLKTMPQKNLITILQYQMIRHGATYGSSEVDGSSLRSELDPEDRDDNPVLKRFFLLDGAYQWIHIIKAGAEWNLPTLPVAVFGEAGVVISYFTNTGEPANIGDGFPYSVIDTVEYPKSAGFVLKIGFKVYPRR